MQYPRIGSRLHEGHHARLVVDAQLKPKRLHGVRPQDGYVWVLPSGRAHERVVL